MSALSAPAKALRLLDWAALVDCRWADACDRDCFFLESLSDPSELLLPGSFFLFLNKVYSVGLRSVSLFLYIVLGALNRHLLWDMTLTHPAANTLLLHVQVLYVRAGIVLQQPRTIVWFGNQARIHT